MFHVTLASVLMKVSHSSYGRSASPTEPTPMTIPGTGDENIQPKLWGAVTECKCREHSSVSAVSQWKEHPYLSFEGAQIRAQLLPAKMFRRCENNEG
jgi:hypothetical protein